MMHSCVVVRHYHQRHDALSPAHVVVTVIVVHCHQRSSCTVTSADKNPASDDVVRREVET